MTYQLHQYQEYAAGWVIDRLEQYLGAGLLLDMGLGKSLITLDVIDWFRTLGRVKRVLIVAPLRVAHLGWPKEIEKWGFDFSYTVLHGPRKEKLLRENTFVHIINPEGLAWLVKQPEALRDYDLLVVDESTYFKNFTAKRTKALKKLLKKIKKRIILTGTPAPNSYADLFSQMFIVDDGASLGKTLTTFRSQFMQQGGFQGRVWSMRDGSDDRIDEAIAGKVLWMDARDHLDMPKVVYNDIIVDLPSQVREQYEQMEKEMFLELDKGTVEALAPSSKYAMCKSISNGGLYEQDELGGRIIHKLHDEKTKAVAEIVESLNGKPLLCFYQFWHDLERLTAKFPKAKVINGKSHIRDTAKVIDAWVKGKVPLLLAQPQALSHGVDRLQHAGSDIVWYGMTDRNEVYLQANARIYRQGACRDQVRIHHILCDKTVDLAIRERIMNKKAGQEALLDALKQYQKEKQSAK